MPRILIVEDEPDIASLLKIDLQLDGHDVEIAGDGAVAVRRAQEAAWDLILLDLMLPRKGGFDVCRELRQARLRTPIIMLTARTEEAEKVLGFELGADDYVTKPFGSYELRARIKAVLRRVNDDGGGGGVHRFNDFEVDFDRSELRRGRRLVDVTPLQLKLLAVFIRRRGRVLSRQQLIEEAWGSGTFVIDRAVDTHIVNLRRKIEPKPTAPRYLISVRGQGYRFDG
jgi:two-component system alkaline phosphatase synthesis response regulator PhoP